MHSQFILQWSNRLYLHHRNKYYSLQKLLITLLVMITELSDPIGVMYVYVRVQIFTTKPRFFKISFQCVNSLDSHCSGYLLM